MSRCPLYLSTHFLLSKKAARRPRHGFLYQDHVAVSFCVEMLTDGQIDAVWCEVHDDITLLFTEQGEQFRGVRSGQVERT